MPATRLAGKPGERWSYSNLGFGLLGHVLERATGKPYEELLHARVLAPLGMVESGIQPSAAQEARLAPGYWHGDPENVPRPRWRFGEVCAAGGIFSSARDLARYVSALLAQGEAGPFTDATRKELFTPVVDIGGGRRMGLAWFVDRAPNVGQVIGHGGEVDSYSSALSLSLDAHLGLIVLANRGGDSAERVSQALLAQVWPKLRAPASK
jgi:CubicO group peptidase (beta-lactamase class C family)